MVKGCVNADDKQATTVCGVDLSAQATSSGANGRKQSRNKHQFLFSQRLSTRTHRTLSLRPTRPTSDTLDESLSQDIVAKPYE